MPARLNDDDRSARVQASVRDESKAVVNTASDCFTLRFFTILKGIIENYQMCPATRDGTAAPDCVIRASGGSAEAPHARSARRDATARKNQLMYRT